MIAYSYIDRNLRSLDARYQRSRSIQDASFHSKLAILELCGWIEVSMDDVIMRASIRVLKESANRAFVEEKVKYNYGFEYKRHFKSMLVSLVGIWGYEKIQATINTSTVLNFSSELGMLKERRNSLAHTYTRGVTPHYDAPSITIGRMHVIANGLRAYDTAIRNYCC